MAANQHVEHRGIMLHIYNTSIIVEGSPRSLYFRHPVDDDDIEAVKAVLDSGMEFMSRLIQIKQEELTQLIKRGPRAN